ncbi:fused PTS fructose transporter subunit IIA/HPr protein [Vibrio rumoiensis]|uniref:Bifunctional PTS fructose transporter subunit IIA/HPr protein n=1 Tax=Vibrio rumoiensis 1S-45 TaxID=1188252 RepID=A0A1E5E2D9_9VIBR|nr:fused PTS fructose transporter subunit IIA/HPr protein [Vibrio rumoiensis]OEF25564.1 bifunctional PTS fructose transporter subunit IIA/HPr protein [Vibrio rumoiensis 1S-45]
MLILTPQEVTLAQTATDKIAAIKNIAQSLTQQGYVEADYVNGMLNREEQSSTFLGNGIAIPHGTTETRGLVQKTGVSVHHFPKGVDWGNGTVYVAIGIAAKSDEHLGILKQLTKVLSADGVETALKNAKTEQDIIEVLNGKTQLMADFDASLIQLKFPASDMLQMTAVAGGLLRNTGCTGDEYISEIITKKPTDIGAGLWLVSGGHGVNRSAMSFVSTANDCEFEGKQVKGLIAFAACNASHKALLNKLTQFILTKRQQDILDADVNGLLDMFDLSEKAPEMTQGSANTATFKIKNTHGLHARPGAMLVAEAKKFEATIRVENLDGDGGSVNAKSLMKVIALGVKHGHRLQFTADGADAELALTSIGKAIESGLGEG